MAISESLKKLGLTDAEVAELMAALGRTPRNALDISGNDLRAVRDDGTPVIVMSAPPLLGEFGVNANLLAVGVDGTTVTFYVDATTGKLMAGAGGAIIDNSGIVIPNAIDSLHFLDPAGNYGVKIQVANDGVFSIMTENGGNNITLYTSSPGSLIYNIIKTTDTVSHNTKFWESSLNVARFDVPNLYVFGDATVVGTLTAGSLSSSHYGCAYACYDYATDQHTTGTFTPAITTNIPSGAIVVGGSVHVISACTGIGGMTFALGTSAGSSTTSLLGTTNIASLTINHIETTVTTFAAPLRMTSAGDINVTIDSTLTAGKVEIWVFYFPTGG